MQCMLASATASVPRMPAINEGATHDRNMSMSPLVACAGTTAPRLRLQLGPNNELAACKTLANRGEASKRTRTQWIHRHAMGGVGLGY